MRLGVIQQPVEAPGSIVARRESKIGTEVAGRILHVYVFEGDRVKEGDPLFQVDPKTYEVALRQAQAGLDVARAQRAQLQSDLARGQRLRKQDVLTPEAIERLTTSLAVAEAQERAAEAAVALAQRNLDLTLVRAPYPGSVAARLADEGTTALVQPQTIVIVLQETEELEAQATIPESQLSLIRVGDRALVHVEGLVDPIETQVSAVSDTIDPATRTYLVKARVPNADYKLKAGVFAHVEILPRPKPAVLLIPRQAIRTEDGRTRVLVVRDGKAMPVPVELGIVNESDAEVLHGLAEGEAVIAGEAARTIAPGMAVHASAPGAAS